MHGGWDLYGQPATVTITNCTATNNGYGGNGDGNGFKLGSAGQNIPHTVTNCTSSYNKASGYDGKREYRAYHYYGKHGHWQWESTVFQNILEPFLPLVLPFNQKNYARTFIQQTYPRVTQYHLCNDDMG
jgi:hypothetical protein